MCRAGRAPKTPHQTTLLGTPVAYYRYGTAVLLSCVTLLKVTLQRLVPLSVAWGKPDEAAKWRQELAARTADQPEN